MEQWYTVTLQGGTMFHCISVKHCKTVLTQGAVKGAVLPSVTVIERHTVTLLWYWH